MLRDEQFFYFYSSEDNVGLSSSPILNHVGRGSLF